MRKEVDGMQREGLLAPQQSAGDGGATPVDTDRIERAVREILLAIGEDPAREGLRETPRRIAQAYAFLFSGLFRDPTAAIDASFHEEYEGMVVLKDIQFLFYVRAPSAPVLGYCARGILA